MSEFLWSKQREEAALLAAADELTDEQIGKQVQVHRAQIARWKLIPAFRARVREHVEAWKSRFRDEGMCIKERRIQSLLDDFHATDTILRERGKELEGTSGGAGTGFICRDYKGKDADREVFFFDAALMRERRAIREQVAEELGQAAPQKHEHSGKDGAAIPIELVNARELLASRIAGIVERSGPADGARQPDGQPVGEPAA